MRPSLSALFGLSLFLTSLSGQAALLLGTKDLDGIEYDYRSDAVEPVCWLDMKNVSNSTDENLYAPGSTRQTFFHLDGKNKCDEASAQAHMKETYSWLQRRKYQLQRVHKEVFTSLYKGIENMFGAQQTACGKAQMQEIENALKSPKLKMLVKFFRTPLVDAHSRGGYFAINVHDATRAVALDDGEDAPDSPIMERSHLNNAQVVPVFSEGNRYQEIKVFPYLDRSGKCHVANSEKVIETLAPLEPKMAEAINRQISLARARQAELEKKAKAYEDQAKSIETSDEAANQTDAK